MPTKENEVLREEMMKQVNKFHKISEKRFMLDFSCYLNKNQNLLSINNFNCSYDNIKLPQRATTHSAGYDFFSPIEFALEPGMSIKIPTGIKAELKDNCVLLLVPRSSLGFKYKLKFDNTIGVIDSDYFYSDNEGHIWVSLTNMSSDSILRVKVGDKIFQGIIVNYDITEGDSVDTKRNGGFGSTDKKEDKI